MDRTAFAACAGLLLPLGAALNLGCGAGSVPQASAPRPEPRMLELQAMAPGPWRRLDGTSTAARSDEAIQQEPIAAQAIEPSTAPSDEPQSSPTGDPRQPLAPAQPAVSEPAVSRPESSTSAPASGAQRAQWSQAATRSRTPEMAAAIRQADQRVRAGFGRASRGAHFSARGDFLAALKLIARANDAQQSTRSHAQALSAGLAALKESGSFARLGADASAADVARTVAGHETTILKHAAAESLTPAIAAERYRAFAQAQLGLAAAGEAAGSMALFGLAKVALAIGRAAAAPPADYTLEAEALYAAALAADAKNFCAANELGVLLAEVGRLEPAREMLIKSVSISSQAITWHNLAVVHSRLGETQLARQAQARADALGNPAAPQSAPNVQWVDPATFAQVGMPTDGLLPAVSPPADAPAAAGPAVDVAQKKAVRDSLPWNSRR